MVNISYKNINLDHFVRFIGESDKVHPLIFELFMSISLYFLSFLDDSLKIIPSFFGFPLICQYLLLHHYALPSIDQLSSTSYQFPSPLLELF